jgi:hypothetical protein
VTAVISNWGDAQQLEALLGDIEEIESLDAPIGFWEGFAAGSAIATAFVAGLMYAHT